jgi:NAD(P)-dependent dehydrogenase (short-subunit alcohol dehydrogenase family)
MFAQTEKKFGKLDVLIVNAGGAIDEGTAGEYGRGYGKTFR